MGKGLSHNNPVLPLLWLTAFLTLITTLPALAEAPQSAELSIAEDRFTAGDRISITHPVAGDLLSAAGEITVNAEVGGDLLAFGGQVQLASAAMQDVYVGAGQVTILDSIAHNARIAGGDIRLQSGAKIGNNATIAGGNLDLSGDIGGYLLAAGGTIFINGVIDGDVRIVGETIELGPNARIFGRLLYSSENELQTDPAAVIAGGIDRLPWSGAEHKYPDQQHPGSGVGAGYWIWTLGLVLLSIALLALLPRFSGNVSDRLRQRSGWCPLLGLAVLLCTPVAIVLIAITVIGLPIALLLLFSYPVILLLGYVFAAISLGDIVLRRFKPEHATRASTRMLSAALAVIVFSVFAKIPMIGGLIVLLVLLSGTGALTLGVKEKYDSDQV